VGNLGADRVGLRELTSVIYYTNLYRYFYAMLSLNSSVRRELEEGLG